MQITVVGASGLIGTKVVALADQVASAVARAAAGSPLNGIVNLGGPQKITFEQLARDALARKGDDTKTIVVDPEARYFGATLSADSLVATD